MNKIELNSDGSIAFVAGVARKSVSKLDKFIIVITMLLRPAKVVSI